MLKADLHIHTKEDAQDSDVIAYTAEDFIDYASKLGFDVLSITNHNSMLYSESLKSYAEKKGVLLIPGIEKKIKGKEVLIYNAKKEDVLKIDSFEKLREFKQKNKDTLIIAPHPFFFFRQCIGKKLIPHIDLFDGIEYNYFYLSFFNRNKKAVKIAKRYNKPLIGNSDTHFKFSFNHTYTLIDADKNINSVINAIKHNKIKLITRPLPFSKFLRILWWIVVSYPRIVLKTKAL